MEEEVRRLGTLARRDCNNKRPAGTERDSWGELFFGWPIRFGLEPNLFGARRYRLSAVRRAIHYLPHAAEPTACFSAVSMAQLHGLAVAITTQTQL